jgi:galactokinase
VRRDRLEEFGLILNASHASLRDDYEVSSPALDEIVECARQAPGCLGARMTGAGFGGCAVSVLRTYAAEAFTTHVMQAYRELSGLTANVYICSAEAGASVEIVNHH